MEFDEEPGRSVLIPSSICIFFYSTWYSSIAAKVDDTRFGPNFKPLIIGFTSAVSVIEKMRFSAYLPNLSMRTEMNEMKWTRETCGVGNPTEFTDW